jgi:hypothetical protein
MVPRPSAFVALALIGAGADAPLAAQMLAGLWARGAQ